MLRVHDSCTHYFSQFEHQLLQLIVVFESGMWSSSPVILLSEDQVYIILRTENTTTLTEFPSQEQFDPTFLFSLPDLAALSWPKSSGLKLKWTFSSSWSCPSRLWGLIVEEKKDRWSNKDFLSFTWMTRKWQAYLRMPTWPHRSAPAWCFLRCCTPPRRTPWGARKALL